MAAFVLTDCYLSLNATDVSDYVKSVTLDAQVSTEDSTAMGDTWTEMTPGVKSGSLQIQFNDDVANSAIDDVLWGIFGTSVAFELRPTSAAVGASNPKWTGNVIIQGVPFGGAHGSLASKSVTFPTSGTVTRAEA